MSAGLEPGPATQTTRSAPMSLAPSFDMAEALPPGAADRLRKMREHVADLRSLTVPFADIQEASGAKIAAEQRLRRLTDHPHDNGFGLGDSDPRVIEAQRQLDKLTAELARLNERNERRTTAWRAAGHVLQAVEAWLRDGRPPGTTLVDHEVEMPKPTKAENGLLDQIENRRRRVRELRADERRISSACFPSAHCRARMRAMVEALAMQGAPDVANLIEHDREIIWPTQRVQSQVFNTETPAAVGFATVPDALALMAWLHRDALIAALDREIATESDDAASLSHAEREKRLSEVQQDLLFAEYEEAALTWTALEQGLPAQHRADCSPLAILQCRLVTAPRANGSAAR